MIEKYKKYRISIKSHGDGSFGWETLLHVFEKFWHYKKKKKSRHRSRTSFLSFHLLGLYWYLFFFFPFFSSRWTLNIWQWKNVHYCNEKSNFRMPKIGSKCRMPKLRSQHRNTEEWNIFSKMRMFARLKTVWNGMGSTCILRYSVITTSTIPLILLKVKSLPAGRGDCSQLMPYSIVHFCSPLRLVCRRLLARTPADPPSKANAAPTPYCHTRTRGWDSEQESGAGVKNTKECNRMKCSTVQFSKIQRNAEKSRANKSRAVQN